MGENVVMVGGRRRLLDCLYGVRQNIHSLNLPTNPPWPPFRSIPCCPRLGTRKHGDREQTRISCKLHN